MLRLTTFGGVGLQLVGAAPAGGEPTRALELPPRAFALLALLAAASNAGISRDTLLAHLWPESDMERGRNALRQALHSLKRDLAAPELITGGIALRLDPRIITSDVQEFAAARESGDRVGAVARYTGPFLNGFYLANVPEFEQWVEARRAEYAGQVAAMLETLARTAGGQGDVLAAADWWRRLATMDPLSSRIAIGLIEALAAAGDGAGALRHAQAHEELVHRELGAAPDPAILALAGRIRGGAYATVRGMDPTPGDARRGEERLRDRLTRELAGRYLLEGELRSERDGPVHIVEARDCRHDRAVTLRILHPALASQLDSKRFMREIRLTGELLHPHILPLLDSGEVAGCPWYVVPRAEGETLRQRLSRDTRLPADEALRLARELADALGHAHGHGIVHRDVHPENVLLVGGHALVANLGVARALDTAAGGSLTDTGVVVGSPAYMSPEQSEGQEVDGRSDQYTLAAVLVEMLTGDPLFTGPTAQSIIAKRTADPTPPGSSLRGVPAYLTPVLRKALAGRPEDRFATMAAFADALAAPASFDAGGGSWWSRVSRKLAELISRR